MATSIQPTVSAVAARPWTSSPAVRRTSRSSAINIAERLYRITGQGIYRDTVLLGRKAPIAQPLLNGKVTGQDGILNARYGGKLYWFYGDTNRLSYALGNFAMSGATTKLPENLDPSIGFNLNYFVGADGFVKSMAPVSGEGVVWLFGVVVIPDESGKERMLAFYQRRRGLGAVLENGFMVYNDAKDQFEKLKSVPLEPPLFPQGYPFPVKGDDGVDYIYFTAPYPASARQSRLALLHRSGCLRRLHLPQSRHALCQQGQGCNLTALPTENCFGHGSATRRRWGRRSWRNSSKPTA